MEEEHEISFRKKFRTGDLGDPALRQKALYGAFSESVSGQEGGRADRPS